MLENETVKDFLGGLFLVGVEPGDGLELKPELVVGPALVLLEDELVGGDAKSKGELAERIQRRLGGTALIAMNLGLMELDLLGEILALRRYDP